MMVFSSVAFSVMGVCMKMLGGRLDATEVVFFRSLGSFLLMAGAMLVAGRFTRRTVLGADAASRRVLWLRALSGIAALTLYVTALLRIRYAEAAALLYTSPLFTAVFARLFLGETMRARAWVALGLGLAGSALVLRPQFDSDPIGGLCALGSGVLSGIAYTSVRAASRRERGETIVLWFAGVGTPLAAIAMVPWFVWPDPVEWAWILGMATSAQVGQVYLTKALGAAPAGTVTIGAFATLALSAVWGYATFGEALTAWTVAGALCILAGILIVAARRGRRQR